MQIMTPEQIELLLKIYDKCLKYGRTDPKFQFLLTPREPKELFKEKLENNDFHNASYIFSREPDSKAREVLLYYVYRLKILEKKTFTDLLFSVYNMTDTNTSFFTFYSYDTIIKMFSIVETPYLSKDEWNDFSCLTDELTIYRGIRSSPLNIEKCGFSWTLNEEIARYFAFQDNSTNDGYIICGHVRKSDILSYLTNRGEAEIIIAAEKVNNKTIRKISKLNTEDTKNEHKKSRC